MRSTTRCVSPTRQRLEEASFFLRQMEKAFAHHPDFDFFFNAFTTAARSITWVMRAEFARLPGWEAWYESVVPQVEEGSLLQAFTKLRNRSQKVRPLETKAVLIMDISPENLTPEFQVLLNQGAEKRFVLTLFEVPEGDEHKQGSSLPAGAVLATSVGAERRIDELEERDVLAACQQYLLVLERVVSECEALYAA